MTISTEQLLILLSKERTITELVAKIELMMNTKASSIIGTRKEKVKTNGVRLGRPKGSSVHFDTIQEAKEASLSQSKVAKRLGIEIAIVKRHWNIHSEKIKLNYY